MTYTDTAAIARPAAAALAEREPVLVEAIAQARAWQRDHLAEERKATLAEFAKEADLRLPAGATKDALVEALADDRVREIGDAKSLRDLRRAADTEERIIEAIEASRVRLAKAEADVAATAAEVVAGDARPESLIYTTLALVEARWLAGHYESVAIVALNRGMDVRKALMEVAAHVATEVLSQAASGARSSSSQVANLTDATERTASAKWLREARYLDHDIRALTLSY